MTKAQHDINKKLPVIKYAQKIDKISEVCLYFEISTDTYYEWKKTYEKYASLD